ncbi:PilZ domain-containing protein [Denitrobaculum tricleocarpae]|uniref:PilZ domain-containing protein n=1 Tax=Denitrobaculum tricleocarpae TaxID=2591009 RepID=A0A545T214_9PROT|nr:PilZ domain-containing protein [Denitrobaculum tricleocarpae]TQV71232.1 PilZ domain-containing protein [Denitrobaculum tricleocarpae]
MKDDDRRLCKRAYVVVSGQVSDRFQSEQKVDCVILNLSASGAKVRFDDPLMSDQIKSITLAGTVEFEVEVAWTSGVFAGLKFLDTPVKVASVLAGVLPDGCLEFKVS